MELALDSVDMILWTADTEGVITMSEGKALRLLGFEPGQLVGSSLFELYAGKPWLLDHFRRCLRGEKFWGQIHSFSDEIQFRTHYAPLRNGADQVLGIAGCSVLLPIPQVATGRLLELLRGQLYDSHG